MNTAYEPAAFLVYCIEMYKSRCSFSGKAVLDLFVKTGADSYIMDNYEALHTTGLEYTLDDIDSFIKSR
ncbi:MAG: DUF3791 domain-containing protein [Sphaerochaetaceae bacterium]|jgi:hypothetical protein|nr:DUF3791 domain-containing protein [Sphaerochaetaceae bacterium]MDD3163803.1 DUF3791 domain-containing protein [Sphaerochaetaceae bacterium]MDD4397580.1 DUF3791 domain-containing protein [Sphaerochaetaceae bacterium]